MDCHQPQRNINTGRALPSPLGTTLYPQIEATGTAIKLAHRSFGYQLRRKPLNQEIKVAYCSMARTD